jgi:hypothetical protein
MLDDALQQRSPGRLRTSSTPNLAAARDSEIRRDELRRSMTGDTVDM